MEGTQRFDEGEASGNTDAQAEVARIARAFLARASVAAAAAAARDLAPSPKLALEPGWFFAHREEVNPDALAVARREVWAYFAERGIERPIVTAWLEGLRTHLYLGNDLSRCVYVNGSFEPNEFVFWKTVLRPQMVFVDGGANEGLYTLFAARLVGGEGTVLAVEPSSRECHRLASNVKLNRLTNVRLLRYGLHAASRRRSLAIAEYGHEGQNTIGTAVANRKVRTIRHETVQLVTLDDLASDEGLTRLNAVKLDVEGCEMHAIQGGRRTIERFRPLLQVEVNEDSLCSQGSTREELVELLQSLDYRIFVFDSRTGQLRPRRNIDELRLNVIAAPHGWRPPQLPG